jgi:hypothetical protein
VADAELLQGPADLGQLGVGDFAASFRGEEIVAAAVGVEFHEQAVPFHHLDQPTKAARRALLVDQERRTDLAGGVVHGDDQVERRLVGESGVLRAILMQQHAAHRPPRPLAPRGAAPRRRRHRTGPLQVDPGRGVAEPVAVPLLQLLVEMLDGEALVVLLIERAHALELVLGRPPGRGLADPPIDQAVRPVLLVALAPAAQGPLADPERCGRLGRAQTPLVPTFQQLLETHDPDPRKPLHTRSKPLGTLPEPDRSRAT